MEFTKEDRTEIYLKAINKWGSTAQLEMAQEEATELALAVRKFVRDPSNIRINELADEIADVQIMIEQMETMMPNLNKIISERKKYKLTRLENRLIE